MRLHLFSFRVAALIVSIFGSSFFANSNRFPIFRKTLYSTQEVYLKNFTIQKTMLEIQHKTRLFLSMEFIFRLQVWIFLFVMLQNVRLFLTKQSGARRSDQLWFTLVHESPLNIRIGDNLRDKVNFTVSYRLDSSILSPYGIYEPLVKSDGPNTRYPLPARNFAKGKSKMVAWFVSNCQSKTPRSVYAHELSRHIEVDIFGKCGSKLCPRSSEKLCFKLLREEYKFYLSFENSLCKYYVTEKFYLNALQNDVIPIVMGASIEEYQSLAPPYSFIHVDQFESPFKLAEYLKYLDGNDTAYNEYFAWREHGEVKNWHGDPHCEICLLAHTVQYLHPSWVSDVSSWWNDACKDRRLRWDPSTFHSD
ncbi:unnamed protein product [Heterobilharzia americana]|nr:unnamed protein product [Heterobilharzia americana]